MLSWEERHASEEADLIALARSQGFICRLVHERLDEITEALCDGRHDGVGQRPIVVWELRLPLR